VKKQLYKVYALVKYMDIPCPPPMHILIIASFLSVLCNSYKALTVSITPVAPIG